MLIRSLISFLLLSFSMGAGAQSAAALQKLGLQKVLADERGSEGPRLVKVWDSVSYTPALFAHLSLAEWEPLFRHQYHLSILHATAEQRLQLAFPLAFLLHAQAKFREGLPVLEHLYHNLEVLDRKKQSSVLIKVEEEYRALGDMEHALQVRSRRVDRGDITTFWELYAECGLNAEAIKDYKAFEPLAEKDLRKRVNYYRRLASLFYDEGLFDSAIHYYNVAKKEAGRLVDGKSADDVRLFDFFNHTLSIETGSCYAAKEEYAIALPLVLTGLANCNEGAAGKWRGWSVLAQSYIAMNKLAQALPYIDSIQQLPLAEMDKRAKLQLYKLLALYYQKAATPAQALQYLQRYQIFSDSLNDHIRRNQAVLVLARMEMEKRRNELIVSRSEARIAIEHDKALRLQLIYLGIALVAISAGSVVQYRSSRQKSKARILAEQQNIRLQQYAEEVEQQNEHNKWLIRELHHRVKNNLQVMYSLLNLQKRGSNDENLNDLVTLMQSRVHSMALVHQDLHISTSVEQINLDQYLPKLAKQLRALYGREDVELELNLVPIMLPVEKAIPLGLVINEALTNAFKYAFPQTEGGKLSIVLSCKCSRILLRIGDNGAGLRKEQWKESSLGLKLIRTLCAQIGGSHRLEVENGVEHIIEIKKDEQQNIDQ